MFRYALAIFVSAFLLFQVQPLIGRFILPWFGGGPSIWTACMLFFQVLLLGGYLYAHFSSACLSLRRQVLLHLALLTVSLACLPIAPSAAWKPTAGEPPLQQILLLLLATVGGPYFLLAATGPLMQRWFSCFAPGRSPWRLYALSNAGSLLALLSYPFAVEPWLPLQQQVLLWTGIYVVFALAIAWCGLSLLPTRSQPTTTMPLSPAAPAEGLEPVAAAPGWGRRLLWLGLAACGSAILLATTNQLCIDVATVPFLWILPLSLYLITLIICFDNPHWYDRRVFGTLLAATVPAACWVLAEEVDAPISDQVVIYSAVLFACCMTCHGELVHSRPHPQYLTLFYLLVSAGGAVGGLCVAVLAPLVFSGYWEYHTALASCCLLTLVAWMARRVWQRQLEPAFWAALLTVSLQAGLIGWLVLWKHAAALTDVRRTVLLAVCGLLQLAGLAGVAARESQSTGLWRFWTIWTVLQAAWLLAFASGQFAQQPTAATYAELLAAVTAPAVCCGILLAALQRLDPAARTVALHVGMLLTISLWLSVLWYSGQLATWQVVSLATAIPAALLMEWAANGLRGPGQPAAGCWFWITGSTLLILLGTDLWHNIRRDQMDNVHTSRNFYGVLRVRFDEGEDYDDYSLPPKYSLTHGQIQHGFQYAEDDYWKRQPTTYYGVDSGVGLALRIARDLRHPPADADQNHPAAGGRHSSPAGLRVGVIGLGTGTIAAYGQSGDVFRFYEINPDVRALSDRYFTYLSDSPAETTVVLGDARIVMEQELLNGQPQQLDVLAVDAFSSDAIPVHLLTTQCGDVYRRHLTPEGILAIHISNRYLDLNPVVRGLAEHLGWHAFRIDDDGDDSVGVFTSTWILLTASSEVADHPDLQSACTPWDDTDPVLHWTDDYSGLWQVLTF